LGESLYNQQCFKEITLSDETQELLEQNPEGDEIIHLNRLLLQDAYSEEIWKRAVFNELLFENSKALHTQIDENLDLPVDSYNIVGCKSCTITSINELEYGQYNLDYGDGDETVPLRSAIAVNTDNKYIAKYAKHSDLPSHKGAKRLVRGILKGYENDFPNWGVHSVTDATYEDYCGLDGTKIFIKTSGSGGWPVLRGGSGEPGEFTGIGPNGIHIGILGSDYRITNDGVEIYVPEGSVYTLEFQGVDQEYLNIKFQLMSEGGVIKTYIFADLTLDIDGCGEVTFDLTDAMTDPVLRLDNECDGTFEVENVPPSYILDEEQSNDFMAPVTAANITGTMGENDWYTSNVSITLTATDSCGGSGVLATRYRFQGDDAYSDYAGPIQIMEPGTYTMTYYSMDWIGT